MLMDAEIAFLYGEIEEEIHIEVPVRLKEVCSSPDKTDEEKTSYQLLSEYVVYANQQDNSAKSLSMK